MSIWLIAAIPGLLGVIVARHFYIASQSLASKSSPSNLCVTVQIHRRHAVLALVFTFAPWLMLVRALREPDPTGRDVLLGMIVVLSCGGIFLLVLALRRVVFTREGVNVRSAFSLRRNWEDLRNIETTDSGSVAIAKFVFRQGKVVVDSNMDGFRQLVRALEVWPTGNAKPIAERAAKALANWREDPKPKA